MINECGNLITCKSKSTKLSISRIYTASIHIQAHKVQMVNTKITPQKKNKMNENDKTVKQNTHENKFDLGRVLWC